MPFPNLLQPASRFQTKYPDPVGRMEASVEGTAEYIGQMAAELAKLAKGSHLELIAYFLEMAQAEAESVALNSALEITSIK